MTGLKERRRLALYVALGLSAGSGLTLDASTAYANVTITSTDTAHASGINATAMTGNVSGNELTVGEPSPATPNTPVINGDVVGGYSAAGAVTGNTVKIDSITLGLMNSVFGGQSTGTAAVTGNTVTVNGGDFTAGSNSIYGGQSTSGAASNNTVTITGGTFATVNVAGGAASTGTMSNGNKVVLGSDSGTYAANLSQADVWGTRYAGDAVVASGNAAITGNTLAVNAQNVAVNKVRNFENYQFSLNEGVAENASMLTVADTDGFGTGANVQWGKIQFDATGWNDKPTDLGSKYYGKNDLTLLKTSDGNQHLVIHNATASPLTREGLSGDFEYQLATDNPAAPAAAGGAVSVAKVTASVNRIRNAKAFYDGTAVDGNAVRGGYSEFSPTGENSIYHVTNNKLTVSHLLTGGLDAAYGGEVAGLAGSVLGNALYVRNTDDQITPTPNHETLTNAYGGAITRSTNAGDVKHNAVSVSGGIVQNANGGYTAGNGTVEDNRVFLSGGGTVQNAYGGKSDRNGTVIDNVVSVMGGGTVSDAYGAYASGAAALTHNSVLIDGGTAKGTTYGAKSTSGDVDKNEVFVRSGSAAHIVGADSATGKVSNSRVMIAGGTVGTAMTRGTITGAQSADGRVTDNGVTMTGGVIHGDVYAVKTTGNGTAQGNFIRLGDEDHRDLTQTAAINFSDADLIGAAINYATASSGNNDLRVYAKNAAVHSVSKFDNYRFDIARGITDGATMLTISEGGFGDVIDGSKIIVENKEKLMEKGNPGGQIKLAQGNATHLLKFKNNANKHVDLTNTASYKNIEYVLELTPDTLDETEAGVSKADALLLTYAKFKDNVWAYDAAQDPSERDEVFGGISYYDKHDTDNNTLTVDGIKKDLAAAYGGKTNGLANAKNNHVTINHTNYPVPSGTGKITKVVGGFTGEEYSDSSGVAEYNDATVNGGTVGGAAAPPPYPEGLFGGFADGNKGKAQYNRATVRGGSVTNVYGGVATKAGGEVTRNKAELYGGTVTNVYGGAVNNVTSAARENLAEIRGGTVTGVIAGARAVYDTAATTHKLSNKNTVRLGVANATRALPLHIGDASVYGTQYHDTVTDTDWTFAGDSEETSGNTLNVTTTGVSMKKVRNFDAYQFTIGNNFQDNDVMLTLSEAGGFGSVSGTAPAASVKTDWTKVKADTSQLIDRRGEGIHGRNHFTLMQEAIPGTPISYPDDLAFANYTDTAGIAEIDRAYEKKMTADVAPAVGLTDTSANKVLLELNRFRDDEVTHDGTATPASAEVYGGYSGYDHTGIVDGVLRAVGTTTESNILNITGVFSGTSNLKAYGGYAGGDHSAAVNNHVNVNVQNTTPGVVDSVYGGYASGSHAGAVRGNTATLDSGIVVDTLAGGYADSANSAGTDHNTVRINGGTVGTYTDPSTSATVTHDAKVYGGYGATATDNTVDFASGKVTGTIYGGYAKTLPSAAAAVKNNVVKLGDNAEVVGDVYGGYADAVPGVGIAAATDNTIDLYKATISGVLYGGAAKDSANNTVANGTGNTLSVRSFGAQAGDVTGVQNLHFYIPAGTTGASAAASGAMLTLNNVTHDLNASGEKDLSSVNIGVALAGNQPTLQVGDEVSLVKAFAGATPVALSPRVPTVNHTTGMQGVSMLYGFDILTRPTSGSTVNNELYAGVTSASINPQTKSLAETRAASLAFMSGGSDLLTDAALTAALDAASTPASGAGQVNGAPKEYHMWAVQSGSSVRLNTGSHVDAKGWNIDLGFAKQRASGRNILTYGPFVEYGKGSYDSYLDDGVHGDGSMDYLGAGFMAKSTNENGSYVEGSVRAGRVKSDYAGTISGTHVTYDSSSTYYAGHLGVGQEKALHGGNTIETYAKYFFAHQDGDRTTLSNGDVYDFDAADSHRLRVGTRYTTKHGSGSFYTGLAYEYEFSGDAGASYQGYNTPSPSLKGGTGILELGYRFAPKDERVSYGVNLMGMTGKRRGISGGIQINWAF